MSSSLTGTEDHRAREDLQRGVKDQLTITTRNSVVTTWVIAAGALVLVTLDLCSYILFVWQHSRISETE